MEKDKEKLFGSDEEREQYKPKKDQKKHLEDGKPVVDVFMDGLSNSMKKHQD